MERVRRWGGTIAHLAEHFEHADPNDEARLIGLLYEAMREAPPKVAEILGPVCDRATAARLLDHVAPRELAFQLAGRAGMMVSRTPNGQVYATLNAHGLFPECSAEGPSEAIALGRALSRALTNWAIPRNERASVSRATH